MNRQDLRALLEDVQAQRLTPEAGPRPASSISAPSAVRRPRLRARRSPSHHSGRDFPKSSSAWARRRTRLPPSPSASSRAGHSLLVTRTDARGVRRCPRRTCPTRTFHELARSDHAATGTRAARTGHRLSSRPPGTADLPVAEEAAVTAEMMGNTVDRLYDVGVAGLHRLLAEHAPPHRRARHHRRRRHGRRAAERRRRAGRRAGHRRADERRLRRELRRPRGALGMLNSCATGVSVVNIDNGFGAAAIASSINHLD